ncbi:MAG: sensor histidine kinase [Gemmatimonadota bacterium]
MSRPSRPDHPRFSRRVILIALGGGAPATALALALIWTGDFSDQLRWTLTLLLLGAWTGGAALLREHVIRPIQTLANLLGALREGDYSIRARDAAPEDDLGLAFWEFNTLGDTLRAQRIGALEATALLRKVMVEIDVAVFAFDDEDRLRLVNRAGERLLGDRSARLIGRTAVDLGLDDCLDGESPRTLEAAFPGGMGRWELRRSTFRQDGRPHRLLVLSDLTRALREEERQAWRRLIRVLSHEINNSLAPIQSITGSLKSLIQRDPPPEDRDEDLERGLGVIAGRAHALRRFMASYARLARLPPPEFGPVDVPVWIRRTAQLETRLDIHIDPGPELSIEADGDQLDQLLINLIHNAVDASLETGGDVRVRWSTRDETLLVEVEDDGPGLPESANLFVPFFTTKPSGSGIGLTLSRQIAEGHGGTLSLEDREDARGCRARLTLPIRAPGPAGRGGRPGSTRGRTSRRRGAPTPP